jgi:YesN/AraC family two-component response regulator
MQERILLVDDDETLRSEFKDCFEEYKIIEASNGEDALKILKSPNEIDLVILDVNMPGMNGIDVLNRIKKISPEVSIVMFTGYSSKEIVIKALRGKADNYIEKPLDVEETRKIIEKTLESKKYENYSEGDTKGKIEWAKRFIRRNCLRKVKLQDVASTVGLSLKYLSRVFKEHTGIGFDEYKLGLKIDKSKDFLKKTRYNIDQIADKIGYENTESFIRQFKKITGSTPTEYRRKRKWQRKIKK